MGAIDNTKLENTMIDSMWSFLQMGGLKSNYPVLKEACMEMRQMMMQKTAGQRKNRPQDISWDNFERVKATIVVEAMALVLSGDFEKSPMDKSIADDKSDEKVDAAKKNAEALKEFCFEWDCAVCPFEKGRKKCALDCPSRWNLKEKKL